MILCDSQVFDTCPDSGPDSDYGGVGLGPDSDYRGVGLGPDSDSAVLTSRCDPDVREIGYISHFCH